LTSETTTNAPPKLAPQGPPSDKPDYRPALDGLRALAIAAVVAYHLGYADGGFLGVDLFFVLSGYLITGLLVSEFSRTAQISIPRFWARRVRRLYPALIPVIVAVLISAALSSNPLTRSSLRGDVFSSLFYFANWHFAAGAHSYFAQFAGPSPLRHFWSLAIEEQFYLVWPLVVATLLWLAGRRRTWLLAVAAALGAIGSAMLLAAQWNPADPSVAYYSTFCRAHELLVGALLALVLRRRAGATSSAWSTTAVGGTALAAVIVAIAVATGDSAAYYHGGSLAFCVVVAILIAGVERRGPNPVRDLLSLGPVRYLGRISYALYLWHWPVIVWVTTASVALSGAALNAFRLVLMTGAAVASTHLLEEPIRRGRLARWLTPRRVGYALPAVSAVMIPMTLALTRGGGAPARAQDITAAASRLRLKATAAAKQRSATESRATGGKPRVVVFGDSVPELLKPSLEAAAHRAGVRLIDAAVPGCGLAPVTQTDVAGNVVSWQSECDSIAYPDEHRVVARYEPDIVVWFSNRENQPVLVDGVSYRPGTPEHRRVLRRAMLVAHRRLTADGAHLYLVKVTPHADPPGGCASPDVNQECAANAQFNPTVPYVNTQLRWLARRYADTTMISLDGLICPGGPPCPATIDGVPVRPDSTHFSETFAPRVAAALLASTGMRSVRLGR
jgi:peptidoglycan/LPS O-acetylase OafA/YrhL